MTDALVNLSFEQFIKSVSCSCVCSDGYSPGNLVSSDPQTRKRGLRVEHFIRPPLSITFEFKYPLNIASILIKPSLDPDSELRMALDGSHVYGGDYVLSIHRGIVVSDTNALVYLTNKSYPRPAKTCVISSEDVSMVMGSQLRLNSSNQCTIEQPMRHINILAKLKRLTLTVTRLTGVKPFALDCVEIWGRHSNTCSLLEKSDFEAAVLNIPQSMDNYSQPKINLFSDHSIHHFNPNNFPATNDIIKDPKPQSTYGQSNGPSTAGSSEVKQAKPTSNYSLTGNRALKRTNSFPEGASVCSDSKRTKMEEIQFDKDSYKPQVNTSHSSQSNAFVQQGFSKNSALIELRGSITKNNLSDSTPVKFLDSLTYETMLLPMSLPSGHYVDRTTLDKLAYNDSLYGRPPTDPFTGVAFSEQSQPQFCPELKVEIDKFLSACGEVRSQSTVGTAALIAQHVQNSTTKSNQRSHPVQSTSCSLGGPTGQWDHREQRHSSQKSTRKPDHSLKGAKHVPSSFETEVSGSLDVALSKLFS